MGWVIALIIVALFGNFYLFSGYDVKGDVAEFIVAIAIIADILVIFAIAYSIYSSIQAKKQASEKENTKVTHGSNLCIFHV